MPGPSSCSALLPTEPAAQRSGCVSTARAALGLGTTSASANLHVAAANNSQLFLEATDTSPTTIAPRN